MPFDGLSQRAPRLVRARPPHGSDLVVNEATDALFRRVYEFGWDGGIAVLGGRQPLWGTCGPLSGLQRPHEALPLDLVGFRNVFCAENIV